ncbi:MAG: LamG domain-containing protein [Kiritimatiellia bacterium]
MKISSRLSMGLALWMGSACAAFGTAGANLVLHYTFDADAGSAVLDASAYGNDGQLVGAQIVSDGEGGQIAAFDGIDDYVRAPSSASLMPAEVTIAVWVRFDSLPTDVVELVFKRNPSSYNNEAYSLQVLPSGSARFVLANGSQTRLDSAPMGMGEWHHVAATFSRPAMNIYVDGAWAGSANHNYALYHNASADFFLGASDHAFYPMGSFTRGDLDDVRIYNRALAAEEIAALAGAPLERTGPILHYTFDADEGGIVTDDSGNGRTGTVNGATWVADGARGGAYRFDSNAQTIAATDAGLPSGDAPRSIALWMKIDTNYPNGCTGMLGYGTQGFDSRFNGIGFDWRLDRDRVYFSPGGTCFLTARKLPAPGTWIHVAYTYGGNGDHHLYYNGVASDGMSELGGPVDTTLSGLLLLGGHPDNPGPDGGYLDDVRIYDRVLAPEEVAGLAGLAGPIVHYTFDADEGGVVTDDSGNGRTGTVNGATWVADGARGGAYRFDNNSQSISATDAGLPSGDAPRSLALWMKLDRDYPEGCMGMLSYGTWLYNQQTGIGFDWRLDRDRIYFSQNGACFLTARRVPAPGTWIHVAYTYGGNGDHHLYFNGVASDGMSELWGPVNTVLSGLLLLGGHPGSIGPDGGYVDDVRIYDRVLFPEEIAELAVSEERTAPILHYTFDADEGGVVTDDSGNGRTGTVNGATWVADGARGGAYRFDSNAQTITATDAGLPSGDAPRSLALWMKIDTNYLEGCTGMLGYGTQGFDGRFNGIGFDWRLDRDRVYFSPGGTCFLTARQVPAPGTWIHVAYTYGGNGDHHLYYNGVASDGMSELGGPVDTTLSGLLLLGGHPDNPGPDGGYVDDVRIYDRVLAAEEIAELAVADPGGEAPPAGGDLVLHYPFDADDGTTATDASEYGNDGRFVGAGVAPGEAGGQIAAFDGTNDCIQTPSSASLMPEAVTVAAWVRLDSLPEGIAELVFKRNLDMHNNEDYALQVNSCGGVRFVLGNGAQTRLDSSATLGAGAWHHVAATFARPEMKVYVDGALAGTATHDYPLAHNPGADLFIGASDHAVYPMASFAHGALDDVRIYNRSLAADEIAALAYVDPGEEEPPASGGDLILHLAFDADDETTATDSSEYGNDGVRLGGAQTATDGAEGLAIAFDGEDDHIRVPWSPTLDADDLTITAWVKIEGAPGGLQTLVFKRVPGLANGVDYALQLTPEGAVRWVLAKKWQTWLDTPPLKAGTWHHVSATFSRPDMNLYLDGLLVGSARHFDRLTKNAATDLFIGAEDAAGGAVGSFARCQMDEVRFYKRVLSEAEIAEQAGSAGSGDLVLRYVFDADVGETAADSSGYGNDGQLVGAQIAENGMVANGVFFDGTDDYIRAASSESLMPEAVTLSAWVRFDSLPTGVMELFFKRNAAVNDNESYALQIQSGGSLRFTLGNGDLQTLLDSAPLGVGEWHHVAATFARPEMKIYVDGALVGTAAHDYPLAHNPATGLLIGASDHAVLPMASFAHGMLDDVRMYRRALGGQEIAALVEQGIVAGTLDSQDADQDGFSNLAERKAGTNPLDDGDMLVVQSSVALMEDYDAVVLRWTSVPGVAYQILWTSDLISGFRPLVSGILATGPECAYTNQRIGAVSGFYMIQVQE